MNNIFEYLKQKDLLKSRKPNLRELRRLEPKKVIEYAEDLLNLTRNEHISKENSIYAHSVSLSLGGGRDECSNINCRLQRLDELSRTIVLYSEKAYINNFFSDYSHFGNLNRDVIQQAFFEDVLLLSYIEPLIKNGLIIFVTPPGNLCPHCLSYITEENYLPETHAQIAKVREMLENEYLDNCSVALSTKDAEYEFLISGSEEFLTHGGKRISAYNNSLPKPLLDRPRLLKELHKKGTISISKTLRKELNFHKEFAGHVLRNLSFQRSTSQVLGTTFLTDKVLDVRCLQGLTGNRDIEERNRIASKYMTSLVPFVNDVSIDDMCKLRLRERESLIQFRASLNKAIDEFRKKDPSFTEKTAREVFCDIIEPKLVSLDKKLQASKQDLVAKASRSIVGTVGALSFGLYTGLIPTEIIGIAKTLGLTKIVSDLIPQVMALGDADKSIRNEDLYFLWKLKQKT
ncbi:hypothetical protein KP003_00360 [Geomonas nitrogeniifigens]|uniref:hypothetical protein n=1 Tax=Geomonas diazotrophica TaxID=2843197 RepID=UPI001C2CB820|nr:hypothetical protein [Geomonas nitrogeniifigens]QXE86896.1 hypothetical protein KP003_00360 [Geomonas nitrogeniifigens]